jgi:hypothetical protein
MAQSGHPNVVRQCPLLGVSRTLFAVMPVPQALLQFSRRKKRAGVNSRVNNGGGPGKPQKSPLVRGRVGLGRNQRPAPRTLSSLGIEAGHRFLGYDAVVVAAGLQLIEEPDDDLDRIVLAVVQGGSDCRRR